MRWTQAFIPTLKEDPKDAEVVSHKLMVRAGMMRKVGAGIYEYLPLGWRVIQKVAQIIREEMNRAGAQELLMPVLSPAELWRETGRWDVYGKELMRLRDRHDHDYVLGPTHEEVITDLVRREVRSYRELPLCLYQIQTKFRDEIRPRFGVMRGREFLMKDAYSFHATQEDLLRYYELMRETYIRIFARCGLETRVVVGHSGAIGGRVAHELMVLADSGESCVLACPDPACGYTATDETAEGTVPPGREETEALLPLTEVATPGKETIEEVAAFLGVPTTQCVKALLYRCDDKLAVVFVRGDRDVNAVKLHSLTGANDVEMAGPEFLATKRASGVVPGYCGPLGITPDFVFFDLTVQRLRHGVIGANKPGWHCTHFCAERDLPGATYLDLVRHVAGDLCPQCGTPMTTFRGIEVGNIFQLGTKYSDAMRATFLNADNVEQPFIMGCYGIGVTRTVAAAIEQHHDEEGIIWPRALAPFDILIQPLDVKQAEIMEVARQLEEGLTARGYEVLMDDRDAKPGFKFKDGDLIGVPLRVTISPRTLGKGGVEVKRRVDKGATLIPVEGAVDAIIRVYESCP
ncbi:MAG: proline--tRNA ligase [bacterium]|nr:proline--tRNA ligase [bacterium]